jgi:hypothetical protein
MVIQKKVFEFFSNLLFIKQNSVEIRESRRNNQAVLQEEAQYQYNNLIRMQEFNPQRSINLENLNDLNLIENELCKKMKYALKNYIKNKLPKYLTQKNNCFFTKDEIIVENTVINLNSEPDFIENKLSKSLNDIRINVTNKNENSIFNLKKKISSNTYFNVFRIY